MSLSSKVRAEARELVKNNPQGIRFKDLVKQLHKRFPTSSERYIRHLTYDLQRQFPLEISKPTRGVFAPNRSDSVPPAVDKGEANFYKPLAEWLVNDIGEATVAVPFGGAALRIKWGTPDVVGVFKAAASDLIKFSPEIVSAELKLDTSATITAFGQAIAYRLFSHKVYIAMPNTLPEGDMGRLESLCLLFGVGLVLFKTDPDKPDFNIRVRAQRFVPDMFYLNEFASTLSKTDKDLFNQLFG